MVREEPARTLAEPEQAIQLDAGKSPIAPSGSPAGPHPSRVPLRRPARQAPQPRSEGEGTAQQYAGYGEAQSLWIAAALVVGLGILAVILYA